MLLALERREQRGERTLRQRAAVRVKKGVLGEDCRLVIVEATPTAYTPIKPPVKALPSDRCWTVPALSGGVVYLRDLAEMRAYRLTTP